MTSSPAWVATLSDTDLLRRFGAETIARGQAYCDENRVGSIRAAGSLVMATVSGSRANHYQTSVVCTAGPASLVATCTCPVRRDCKHAVALLARLRRSNDHQAPALWRQALAPLVPQASGRRGGTALALQLNLSYHEYSLRPLRRGAREAWVKSGATWDDIRLSVDTFDPKQREVLLALLESRRRNEFAWGHRTDALPLGELRPDAWALLRRARDLGIPLLSGDNSTRSLLAEEVLLAEPAEPAVSLQPAGGGVRLTTSILVDGEPVTVPRTSWLGRPAHGVALERDGRLVLAPLTRPLDQSEHGLFVHTGALDVPGADLPLFAAGYLPALRRRVHVEVDPAVDLPAAAPPVLVCRVEFGEGSATLRWSFRYRLGDTAHELGLTPAAHEPPLRQPDAEAALAASVPPGPWVEAGAQDAPELRPAFLTGRALFSFTGRTLPQLEALDGVEVILASEAPVYTEAAEAPEVLVRITEPEAGDWFNLDVQVVVDGEVVPFALLFGALATGRDHLLLDSGVWFSLDRPEFDQLRSLIEEASQLVDRDGDTFQLRPEHAGLWAELVELGVVTEQSEAWQRAVGALLDLDQLPEVPTPAGLRATLRPYQQTGYAWLSFLWRTRLGGILADEMGLGKTVQALALAQSAYESGELDAPLLVVAPTSVLGTWASEAARFAPALRVVSITETLARRGTELAEAVAGAHIVLTSYTLLRLEADAYIDLPWSAVLLDEAQFVKNHASKAYQAVRKLRARVKVALTGTPLENNLMDLWSLLSITAPGLFPQPKAFTETFRKPIEGGDAEALGRLHRRIRPLMLRRTKAAVASELPDKQEQVVAVELTPGHRKLYDRHLARERQKVLGLVGDLGRNRITILRSLTLLRQLSLSPALVDDDYPGTSAKIDALIEMLGEVIAEGHRALVFSQFTGFLSLVRRRMDDEGISYAYLDGRTRDRAARIDKFKSGDDPVFLISLKAGGFGLTLTEADYVFILDPWWNPAAESQAIDRTHRIGQDKPVNVYRLVAADTIEEKVVALQESKRDLFASVVGQASDMAAPLSADDIRGLLEP
ncbi:MAG: DEAD/DEAH box helicase [Propioniciclava sp.]|uniref:DEAD/DEAH box helicase n=1 Tax=Propioniciclava sp. TaxID=2038686 RepID=UPI0039E5B52D